MNRRSFLRKAGLGTAAVPVALVVGLPALSEEKHVLSFDWDAYVEWHMECFKRKWASNYKAWLSELQAMSKREFVDFWAKGEKR